MNLDDVQTPFLAVDRSIVRANVDRLRSRLDRLGAGLRPHLKTAKSVEVARPLQDETPGPIAVSTLAEAEAFADAGYRDILYAVGIAPHKLGRVTVLAAERLRAAGHELPVVSVGSTPTAHFATDLTGVTEVRAGNFVFFDLVMAGIGVCTVADLAMSVIVTVIGHRPDKGWILTDGGWMATSRDRGTSRQRVDQAYGLVADLDGTRYDDLLMSDASQEHGILSIRPGSTASLPDIPIGVRVRILPIHACATAAQHDRYQVIEPGSRIVQDLWTRVRGW